MQETLPFYSNSRLSCTNTIRKLHMQFTVVANKSNCELRWQGASAGRTLFLFLWKLMLSHMQRAGPFCERPVQWSHTKPALQILHGPRSSASHRSFSTCPAVHLLILPARRRLPGTSSHLPELLRRRLLQFLFAERHRTLLFLFQDGSSDGVHPRNPHPPLRESSGHFRPAPTAKPGSLFVLPSCTIHFERLNRPASKPKEPVPPYGSPAPRFARLRREKTPTGPVLHSSLHHEGPEENPPPGKGVFRSPMWVYSPLRAYSSAGLPCSTTMPPDSTTT